MNRCGKIAEKLSFCGLDAMLITGEVNRRYATDFHTSSGMVLVTEKDSWFITDSRYYEAACKEVAGTEIICINSGEKYVDIINRLLADSHAKTLGYEENVMTCGEFKLWQKDLKAELRPGQEILSGLRRCKDAEEISRMKKAQEITDKAFLEILDFIRPGVTELEVAARLQYSMLLKGAEKMSFDPIVVSGAKSSMPHGVPGEKRIEKGDFVTMDFGCVYKGYCSDMTRTVVVGRASDEMKLVYETVLEAQKAGIEAYRAGVPGSEVDRAARQVISSAGYGEYFGHSFGHSLGLEIHENPNASPGEKNSLEAGTVISAEPGIYIPGKFGVRIEDVIHITVNGTENFTKSAKELTELD